MPLVEALAAALSRPPHPAHAHDAHGPRDRRGALRRPRRARVAALRPGLRGAPLRRALPARARRDPRDRALAAPARGVPRARRARWCSPTRGSRSARRGATRAFPRSRAGRSATSPASLRRPRPTPSASPRSAPRDRGRDRQRQVRPRGARGHGERAARSSARASARARAIWVAGSTRDGEEALLLDAFAASSPPAEVLLVIVPRHPQRFDEVAALAAARGLAVARRSAGARGRSAGARASWATPWARCSPTTPPPTWC